MTELELLNELLDRAIVRGDIEAMVDYSTEISQIIARNYHRERTDETISLIRKVGNNNGENTTL